jgi:phenylacetic acid degradation operon negative regulatory protein
MKTSDLLTALLYGLDMALDPTLPNLTRGVPDWAQEHGLRRRDWERAGRGGWTGSEEGNDWVGALTETGRLRALGGRDPEERNSRQWDGRWRVLMFDLSNPPAAMRQRLSRWLHANHFGCLQRSVWVTPDACPDISELFAGREQNAGEVVMLESAVLQGFADGKELAESSWDFAAINSGYRSYLDFVQGAPARPQEGEIDFAWIREEGELWRAVVAKDPMLPSELLPTGYLGGSAWAARRKLIGGA